MIIRKIKIKNYRQFQGDQVINLQSSLDTNINIIKGSTGAGKSCIYNMIHWVLYNDDKVKSTNKESSENLLNNNIFMKLEEGDSDKVNVEIEFGSHELAFHKVSRSIKIKRLDGLNHSKIENKQLILTKNQGENNWKVIEAKSEKTAFIERHFPSYISDLFFFDGEKLDLFFNSTDKDKKLDDFIMRASGLDTIENIIIKLDKYGKSIVSGDSDEEKNISKIEKDIREEKIKEKSLEKEISDIKIELERLTTDINKGEEQRKTFESIKEQNKKIDALNKDIEKKIDLSKEEKQNYFGLIVRKGPSFLLKDELTSFSNLVNKLEDEGKIPPRLDISYVKELLKSGECICGRHLEDKSRKALESISAAESYVGDALIYTEGRTHVEYIMNDIDDFENEITTSYKKIKELKKDIEDALAEKDEIFEKIKDIDQEEIQQNIQAYNQNIKRKDDLTEDLGGKKYHLKTLTRHITQLETDFKKLLKKSKKTSEAARKTQIIVKAKKILNKLIEDRFDKLRNDIELETNKQFKKMIWKEETFKEVKLDDNFKFKVYKDSGLDAFASLSQGERQILAFSFIAALSYVANIDKPLIIDTPFGRIDDDPTENIARALKEHLTDFQITFLLTGKEFSEEVKQVLRSNIGNSYELDYDKDFTNIKEMQL